MKAVQPIIASNGITYLQMRSVGSHSTSGIEKEGKKELTGWAILFFLFETVDVAMFAHDTLREQQLPSVERLMKYVTQRV